MVFFTYKEGHSEWTGEKMNIKIYTFKLRYSIAAPIQFPSIIHFSFHCVKNLKSLIFSQPLTAVKKIK